MDIWASKIMKDSSYERPLNLTDINTPEDDITPFFHNASQTLYFSSEGRQGFGSYDIYKCELHDGQWLEVEHLPAPFNSSYGDSHFWMNPEQTKGYFASSRLGSHVFVPEYEACCNDIYEFQVQVIDLEVLTFNKKNFWISPMKASPRVGSPFSAEPKRNWMLSNRRILAGSRPV